MALCAKPAVVAYPSGPRPGARATYARREPDKTVLHQVVSAHLEAFLRWTRDNYNKPLPQYVERELRSFLSCGLLREPSYESNEPESINEALDGCRAVGHGRGRFERIDARGCSQQELFPELDVRGSRRKTSAWAAELQGYSVEAGVHFGALDRKGREKLLKYCLRPAIATERLSILRDGSIAYFCKYPTRGCTHRIMQPLEFLARLAAIVPPPRFALWRYHGVLAPGSAWRSLIVPRSEPAAGCSHACPTKPKAGAPWSNDNTARKPIGDPSLISTPAPGQAAAPAQTASKPSWRASTSYIPWEDLMRHCFDAPAAMGASPL